MTCRCTCECCQTLHSSQLQEVLGEPKDAIGWLILALGGYGGYRIIKGATKKADRP